ncbi:alg12 alpha-1,6-mannosyltransferase isoform X3 [Megachile rotundata]|nr:PREDICTED: probable Dol-P-Man:Man(7)GlcNAc(2)-PP-Dol alpha-1,6-mannosyltransferase isoform X4 [Megachile rotundata]
MLKLYRDALQSVFGLQFTKWFVAITVTQYHFMYYLSRPLPNIMAMPLVLLALYGWLRQSHIIFIWSSAAAIIIFRAELAMLLGLFLLYDITNMKLTISRLLKIAVPAGLFFLTLTVMIDSIFWRRLVWPEGEVFYFNTVLNKSSEWGTSPFLWYFYSALPRGLVLSYFLVPLGMLWDARVRALTVPGIAFVLLFSFLPHKELRFIIYVFPLLNVSAAVVCHRIWENRGKGPWHGFLALIIIGHLVLNALFSMFLLCVAGSNYPGGLAIAKLHRLEKDSINPVHVHIDVLTAQTGVSRFTQTNSSWIYSKQEHLTTDSPEMLQFTHLLMEAKSKYSPNIKPYLKTHDILDSVDGFSHIALNYNMLPPIRIKTRPIIFIMKRKPNIKYDPKKAKAQVDLKWQASSNFQESTESTYVINDTVKDMEPILDEIMESLEQFEKPLNVIDSNVVDTEKPEVIKSDSIETDVKEDTEVFNVEQISTNLSESTSLETSIETETQNISEIEDDITNNNNKLQHDTENISNVNEIKLDVQEGEENEKIEVRKEQLKLSSTPEGSTIKKVVKKIIQEKLEAAKLKKDMIDERAEIQPTISAKLKRAVPIKKELPQKIMIISKPELSEKSAIIQELKEKSAVIQELKEKPIIIQDVRDKPIIIQNIKEKIIINQQTANERKSINVKESIRNIINQFKEFEKDFVHEDVETTKKESDVEDNEQSLEVNEKLTGDSLNVDITAETKEPKIIKDAKESLKDIINQFKQIKSELTSEEDDQFDKIEATYMERPIAETLMQFSEALKNLIQRRKKSTIHVRSNIDSNSDISKLQSQPKISAGNAQFLKMQNYNKDEKLGRIVQNINAKDSSNSNKAFQEKYLSTSAPTKNVLLNAQNSIDTVSNNVLKHASNVQDETTQKNVGNSSND